MNWDRVDEALRSASHPVDGSRDAKKPFVFPGAVLLVSAAGSIIHHKAFGCRSIVPTVTPMTKDMVFDIASLTKALVTTTLAMKMVEGGSFTLDTRLSRIFPQFASHGKERMTIGHLLSHTSGYAAHHPYYRIVASADSGPRSGIMGTRSAAELIYTEIFRARLENLPGKVAKYSDIGFMLLGNVIENASGGATLDRIAHKTIFQPLDLRSTGFIDLEKIRRRGLQTVSDSIAPTNDCPWRKKIICGEVQDENAWAMGGIAGHAGVFSNAEDIHALATELVNCWHGRGTLVAREVVRHFWTVDSTVSESTWALGWDTPSPEGSSAGQHFSRSGVGHLGYTGCSLWIDPAREISVILLTNRVHPSAENNAIKEFRPVLHDLVMEAMNIAS